MRRYYELGGRNLTISTDAHNTKYLGYGLYLLEDMARTAGFTELTWFEKHQMRKVKL